MYDVCDVSLMLPYTFVPPQVLRQVQGAFAPLLSRGRSQIYSARCAKNGISFSARWRIFFQKEGETTSGQA